MSKDRIEIGDESVSLMPQMDSRAPRSSGITGENLQPSYDLDTEDIRTRVGTLLKMETVSLLLGAGASLDCGGILIGSIPLFLERELSKKGISGTNPTRVRKWLKLFYLAVRRTSSRNTPFTRQEILNRRDLLDSDSTKELNVNLENVLSTLHRWRSVLAHNDSRIRLDGKPVVDAKAIEIDACLASLKRTLACACELPITGKESGLETHKTLIRKLLTRPLNLKRSNIFTLNYDTLIEQAADASGAVLLDGFVGAQHPVFRPESYEQDLYFPGDTTEGRVHRFDRVLHLYKLHGSITWTANVPSIDNPYGVQSAQVPVDKVSSLLIYPTPTKYGETLGRPYSELFRRFANALVRPQSVLFVIGYGFGDEHVNAIILQALAVPSFTLVVVDPAPKSKFVATLRKQRDRRIWIIEGCKIGTLAGFTNEVLPDLRDEEVRKKVIATRNALEASAFRPLDGASHDVT